MQVKKDNLRLHNLIEKNDGAEKAFLAISAPPYFCSFTSKADDGLFLVRNQAFGPIPHPIHTVYRTLPYNHPAQWLERP